MQKYIQVSSRPLAYQENMLTGKILSRRIAFGVGAASLDLQTALYGEPGNFSSLTALELPVNFVEYFPAGMRKKLFERYTYLQTGSLAPLALMENILDEPRFQEEFIKNLESLLEETLSQGVQKVFLDFPMELILGEGKNPEAVAFLKKILKTLYPVLLRGEGELFLPCRIPALPGGGSPGEFSAFLASNMMSHIKASLQIHPHEIPRDEMDMEKLLGPLALDTGSVAFRYDGENGHMLVKAHLAPFLQYLLARGYRGGCFVIPFSNDNRLFSAEVERFASLASAFLELDKKAAPFHH